MNEELNHEQLQLELDQLSKDVKAIGQKRYPRFGSGRLASVKGCIHFTTAPEMEVEQGKPLRRYSLTARRSHTSPAATVAIRQALEDVQRLRRRKQPLSGSASRVTP